MARGRDVWLGEVLSSSPTQDFYPFRRNRRMYRRVQGTSQLKRVLDQNVEEEVKDVGFVAMEEVTFEKIMDEVDSKTQGAQENAESPYDTESEIKIIKYYQAATISEVEEGDDSDSLSGLRSMPDDDLASMTGFETQDSADHISKEGTETLHASADKPAQSDPLGHLHEELCLLYNKLPGLLSDALKDTLPQLIKDSIKSSVSESIAEELPHVEAHDLQTMFKNMVSLLEAAEVFKKANAEGEKWEKNNPESPGEQPSTQVVPNTRQAPPVNEEKALVLHTSEEKSSEEDTSGKKETDDETPAKKLKFLIPSSSIPSPTPLKSIMPEPPEYTEVVKMTLAQFTEHLSKTTSSIFSPTPPREPLVQAISTLLMR
ncbi:hypothetical protein Tco_1236441 [Tanacetum coccineum]